MRAVEKVLGRVQRRLVLVQEATGGRIEFASERMLCVRRRAA